MKKAAFVTFMILLAGMVGKSQNLHLTLLGGMSNYQGDLQSSKITFTNIRGAVGAGVYYELNEKLYLRSQVVFAKVTGSDASGSHNRTRNLSFSSPITEFHIGAEYDILNVYERGSTPYVFGGIGYFMFKPSAIDAQGNKVYLQPLGTEGQGFYQNRKKYNLNSFAIPFGAGFKLAFNENTMVRLELGIRKTFTDYLDDVSTFYVDKAALLANNGPKAVEMAFRGGEYKPAYTYPAEGRIRGGNKSKDYYYIIGASVSFRIGSAEDRGTSGYRSRLGCPASVY